MNEELTNTLLQMKKEYCDANKKIEEFTKLRDNIQTDIAIAIIKNAIQEKNFEGIILVISEDNIFDKYHSIQADIEDQDGFAKKSKISEMFNFFIPNYDYHFSVAINRNTSLVCLNGKYHVIFKNINAIKKIAKEFGFKIKYGKYKSIESYDKIINEMTEKKKYFAKMKRILEN